MKFSDARYVIVADGEGAQACVLAPDENIHESVHRFMCVCENGWRGCDSKCTDDISLIDDPAQWATDESGKQFSVSWPHESGKITLYRLSDPTPIPENFSRLWLLVRRFVEGECAQSSYAELRGTTSASAPAEFLALCEFAEDMGVKLA